ncbi:MAG: putative bifunctional diguanylate cyclase/phosphodiesterase [Aquabacterium sp.]
MPPDIAVAKRSLSCLIQSGAVALLTSGLPLATWLSYQQGAPAAGIIAGAVISVLLMGATVWLIRQRLQHLAQLGDTWAHRAQLSENQWAAVMAHSADGIVTLSSSGHITSANAAISQMFGTRHVDLRGLHISALIPSAPTGNELAAYLLEHDEPSHLKRPELQGKRHNGRHFPLSLSVCCPQMDGDHRFVAVIRDLSATKSMELAMNAAQRHLDTVDEMRRMIVHTAPYAIVILNTHGIIQAINPAGERLLGYPAHDLVGRSDTQRFFDADQVAHRAHMLSVRLNRPIHDLQVLPHLAELSPGHPSEWNLIRADGSTVVAEILVHVLTDEAGQHTGYLATAHDVTQRRQAEDKLHHMAMHDALTALPNRNMLQEQLKVCIGLAERNNQPLAMLFLDVDRFKKINDTLGHHIGDSVLIEVGRRIRSAMRTSDIVARLGGDEFGILLPRITAMSDGMLVAEKVHSLFSEPFRVGPHELRVSASIGLALYPDHGSDSITLMRHADLAMYQAKNAGRNRIEVFSDKMQSPNADTLLLENDLYKALELDELRLFFQPQFDCANGAITGVEALLRWEHRGKLVPPDEFIPLAEETGLIVGMGEWVLRRACQRAQQWRTETGWPLRVAVNLSAVQLEQANILDTIQRVLRDTGLAPTALELEITESVVVRESLRAADILNQLRAIGVSIAIDDFGVGYSSFAYLRELPVDRFKLDRSFLNAVPKSEADSRLASALIAMAHRLDVGIVAEGVETAEQAAFLKDHGCDECQGYHLGRPMPESQFEQLLHTHSHSHRGLMDTVLVRAQTRAGRGANAMKQTV